MDEEDDKPNPASAAFDRIKGTLTSSRNTPVITLPPRSTGSRGSPDDRPVRGAGGDRPGRRRAIIATAAGLMIVGIAEGLGRLFGDRYWLGDLVTGLLVLSVIGGAAWFMMKKLTGSWRSQTVKKYEQRKQTQRVRFGHDVKDRATEGAAAARTARQLKNVPEADYLTRQQDEARRRSAAWWRT